MTERLRRGGPVDPRLLDHVPAVRAALAGLGAMSALGTVATIAQAVLLARVVTAVFVGHATPAAIGGDVALLGGAMAVKALAAGATEWIAQQVSARARARLRSLLLCAVARLGPSWLSRAEPGVVVTTAGAGIESLDGYLTRALPAIVAAAVAPPLVLAAIGRTDWPSLVILVITLPLVPVFLALIGITTRRHMDRQWATLHKLAGQFLDLVEGLTTLKVYGRSAAQVRAIREGTERYRARSMATLRVAFLSGLVLDLLATLSVAVVAVAVGLRLDHGAVGLQRALTVLLLAPEVFLPLRAVGAQHHAAEEAHAVIGAAMDIIEEAGPPAGPAEPGPPSEGWRLRPDPAGTLVSLGNVTVRYPQRNRDALRCEALSFGAGGLTALIGVSGAGKTTLLSLLAGQVQPSTGLITAGPDGAPMPPAHVWAANIAWLPQRPRPTQDTVAAEVRLGDAALGDDELARILELCAAPAASTPLGEDGTALSAGQRRRVALARVVARAEQVAAAGGTPLVLLDEPTEDLDAGTEAIVAKVITDVARWATVIAATHDPSVMAGADRIVRVDDGRICDAPPAALGATGATRATNPTPVPLQATPIVATPLQPTPLQPTPVVDGASASASVQHDQAARGVQGRGGLLPGALRAAPRARRSLLLAAALGGLGGVSGLALTATSVWLLCRASQHPNVQALAVAVVGVRTFALARALLRYAERLVAHDGALRLLSEIRARVFAALEPLTPAALGTHRRGDLLRRFTGDVDGAQEALLRAVIPLAGALSTVLAAVVLIGMVDVAAAWLLTAGLLIAGVVVPAVVARAGAGRSAAAAAAGRRDALANGLLDGLAELTAYGAVDERLAAVADADDMARRRSATAGRAGAVGATATGVAAAVTVTAIAGVASRAVWAGATPGVLLGVILAVGLVAFDAVGTLPAAYAALGRCLAGLRRVESLLAAPVPIPVPANPQVAPHTVQSLGTTGATLRPAPGAEALVVDGHLALEQGQRVGIVGPSGSGKSTLLASVLRLLPTDGQPITLRAPSGRTVAVGDLDPADLPPLVAGSLQGDHVFSTTLRDNIRVVAPAATDDDLDAVAERVGLLGWVRCLPDGWDTQAGADGCRVSGGQRQRLLLARAILANPQVLVLDEPTAHLDPVTEAAVMEDLVKSTKGHTLLLSTHRTPLLRHLDSVLRIDNRRLEVDNAGDVGPATVAAVPPGADQRARPVPAA